MGDPVLMTVVGVGAALTKVFLRACDAASAADLVEDGQDLFGAPSRVSRRSDGSRDQVERGVSRALAARIQEMHKHRCGQDIDGQLLSGACTEVEIILNEIADVGELILSAVLNPDSLPVVFHSRASQRRLNIEEAAEPYFDELIEAVATQYAALVPWSTRFQIEAFKSILSANDENRDYHRRSLHAHDITHEMLAALPTKLAEATRHEDKPSRVFFGSRPDAVAGDRFVERDEQEQLAALITDPKRHRTVLLGMRGCGKTQLAASLAKQCEDANWNLVAWINAVSRESIQSDLVELAKQLGIGTSDLDNQEQIVRRCLGHLRNAPADDRLIVFDNVENIDDLAGLVPSGKGLRVVATTTNNTGWGHHDWKTIKVGVFDRSKSIGYLLTVTNSTNHDAADTLARCLGDLPLALAQAAATALNEDWTLTQYLRRLETHRSEQVIRSIPGDEYPHDVYGALRMAIRGTLNNLDEGTRHAARRQLGALALLAESGVPTRWLDPTIEQQDNREVQDTNRAEDETAHEALTELIHRSIIQQSADKATTMLHRLQAQVLRESWNEQDNKEALESAAALLRSVSINKFSRNATALRRRETLDLIEQLRAIGEQRHSQLLFTLRTITASLFQGFSHAHDLGLACAALTLEISANSLENTPALDLYERLNLHICLAQAYQAAGNLPKAIYRYRQVLEVCTRTFGKGDPRTLSCRNYLASAYQAAGNLPEAIYLYEQVLRDTPPIVGKYHPNTLNTRISLASAYQEVGDIHKAIDRYKQVCKDCIKALGENHPETLRSRINLAYAYQEAGDVDKAISSYEQLLQDCTRILGQDHPHTLTTRNNLASAYESAGHKAESISSYEQLLQDCTRILGQEHPHTLATRNNLAHSYALAGDIPKALEHWLKTYADCQRILGHHHPLAKAVHKNVATADQQLKQQEEDSATE